MTAKKSKSSKKKKVIITLIVIGAILLLIGSFFIRDLALRAGLDEYTQKEIVLVRNKYTKSFDEILKVSTNTNNFRIVCNHKGIFEKSEIIPDENGQKIYTEAKEHIDVLCHTYCYDIYKNQDGLFFEFNSSGSKLVAYTDKAPEKVNDGDIIESLEDNWYYIERK